MLNKLFGQLFETKPGPLAEHDSRLALAVLLVRVGRSDDEFSEDEKERVEQILALRYALSKSEAVALREDAEVTEQDVTDSVSFTRALKQSVPLNERVGLLEALWEVALADGERDYNEDGYLRMVCRLLGVNDRDSALARQHVLAKMQNRIDGRSP
ncbi:MAG: TerB family tellurite resistance protein [Rhodobacteraceae bacterium]|nr:TerB family tellurite resistance protein [Paracoccaceae bacterium]MCY4195580.1 TerB family tellurite resistance protein [Paracoccaceae bacterium]MCY4326165.1 TerB family tellurite resistance protein [Paracoccaceae bacterium]